MSMWDWDEQQGESYPPEERQQHGNPCASHSGRSDHHGGYRGHQSCRNHSHHHHGHAGHSHHHHHHGHDNAHSYHGQQLDGPSPSQQNCGALHVSYGDQGGCQNYHRESYVDEGDLQNFRQHDSYENQGPNHDPSRSPSFTSNMAHDPAVQSAHNEGHQGHDTSAGDEIQQEHHAPPASGPGHETSNRTDLFTSDSIVNLTLDEIDALARAHRSRSWLVVLYAPWCRFCQAMEPNFERVAQHLDHSNVYVGRFRADGNYKEYAKRYLQLEHFPTILFFPKDSSNIVKYHSENREVNALLGFVQAFEKNESN